MCGVVGLLIKDEAIEPELGSLLVPMIAALSDRGPDSAGIAVYSNTSLSGEPRSSLSVPGEQVVRISLGSDAAIDWDEVGYSLSERFGDAISYRSYSTGALASSVESQVVAVLRTVEAQWPEVKVLGTGRSLSVIKDVGRPEDTCKRYDVSSWSGYMAVAHTRMATESAVTVLHSHPFVPDRDLCVIHNGSFSNYASVRRKMMAEGVRFDSDNDSEVAARFLAGRLAIGDDLEEATRWVMKEMDGFFTMVITADRAMSVVRDAFACKPAVVAETDVYVAVASEYRALADLPGIGEARVFEPQPEEVYTWKL